MSMKYYAGIDVGSLSADAAIVDETGEMKTFAIQPTGRNSQQSGSAVFRKVLEQAGIGRDAVAAVVSTGYSRKRIVEADSDKTEISCHAKGITKLIPGVHTLIDIGGQDSKVISIDDEGKVADFAMNEKCAAGTGRFLEVMAHSLDLQLGELGGLALQKNKEIELSSTCTVFAESEVVSLVSQGEEVEDISFAICAAIARRTAGLVERVGRRPVIAMSGGVAKNKGVLDTLEKRFDQKIVVPEEPQIVGALGAALFALEMQRR